VFQFHPTTQASPSPSTEDVHAAVFSSFLDSIFKVIIKLKPAIFLWGQVGLPPFAKTNKKD